MTKEDFLIMFHILATERGDNFYYRMVIIFWISILGHSSKKELYDLMLEWKAHNGVKHLRDKGLIKNIGGTKVGSKYILTNKGNLKVMGYLTGHEKSDIRNLL